MVPVVWLVIIGILARQFTILHGIGQSARRTPFDKEELHDLYKGDGMEDMANSLVSQMSSACDVTHVIVRLLMKEAEERAKLALKLQARIRKLATQLASFNNEPPPPDQIVAFSARVGKHIQNLRPLQVIVFKEVITLMGQAGYSPSTGQFRCPIKGVYIFHVTIISAYNDRVESEVVLNTKSQVQLYSGGSKHGSSSNTVILKLEVADLVWVRVFRNRGRFIHQWSTFNGHLVQPLK